MGVPHPSQQGGGTPSFLGVSPIETGWGSPCQGVPHLSWGYLWVPPPHWHWHQDWMAFLHLDWMGVPRCLDWMGVPHQDWMEYNPSSQGGIPILPNGEGVSPSFLWGTLGYPPVRTGWRSPCKDWMGYPPLGLDRVPPYLDWMGISSLHWDWCGYPNKDWKGYPYPTQGGIISFLIGGSGTPSFPTGRVPPSFLHWDWGGSPCQD